MSAKSWYSTQGTYCRTVEGIPQFVTNFASLFDQLVECFLLDCSYSSSCLGMPWQFSRSYFLFLFREVHGQYPVVTPATKQYLQQFEAQSRKSKIKNTAVKVVFLPNFGCQCHKKLINIILIRIKGHFHIVNTNLHHIIMQFRIAKSM